MVDVGLPGEGYSRRAIEIEAHTSEQAIQRALAVYFGELTAQIVSTSAYGTCRVCRETINLTSSGRIVSHTFRGWACRGSQRYPSTKDQA